MYWRGFGFTTVKTVELEIIRSQSEHNQSGIFYFGVIN
jgi:hypothetical protein